MSTSGDTIGTLDLIHDAPLANVESLTALLERLATRAGVELERRQRESALRRSEFRFRLLVDYSFDGLFYYRTVPQPRFDYINQAIEEITGYPPEAFLANWQTGLDMIHEEDRLQVAHAMSSGIDEPIQARLVRADGEIRWVEYRSFALRDEEDQVVAICGSIRDITSRLEGMEARRLSEEYRSALLGAIPDTLLRIDADGTILDYVSGEDPRTLAALAELEGRSIRDLLPPVFVDPMLQAAQAALRSAELHRTEFEVATDSQTTIYEIRAAPFHDKGALLILRDVTAIKWHEGEEDRKRLRDELDLKVERWRTNPYNLTYRELAILHLVAQGQADKQIAESLGISTYTVNKHVGNILGKMAAGSRTEAGVRAIREGLVA